MSQPRLLKLPHVVKEGFIHKEGHNIRKMKKRYFKLIIDIDCHPILEYFDELNTTIRLDLIDHTMNSFIKLILGWESQADHDDWVQAFRTASTLITAHRSGSLGVASSASSSQAQQTSKSDSPATAQVLASTPQILSSPSNHQVAAASPSQSSPVSATNSASESQSQSGASPSPGGSAKAYQRRGSLTVGNNAAAEKREQEKAEAEAEKRALLDKVNGLASYDIEALIEETSRNLQMVSGEERFNPRKQTLEDVLPVLKDKLAQALNAEKLIEEQSSHLSAACELELQKFVVDASLSSDQRIEMQSQLQLYLSQLEGDLRNFKDSKSPSSKIIQVHESNMQAISTRIRQWIELEQTIEAKLKNIIAAKMKFMDTIGASSIEEVAQLQSLYQDLLVKETNPEVRQILSQIVTICTEKLATEQRLEKEAIQFVEGGIFLKKYARDKVMKKSRHEPVSSVVKCVSGTLLWGSHKTGPKIHHVACGPSELLRSSGILMSSFNEKLHLHVTVADESSKTGGREIIDFAGSTEEGVSKYFRGLKKLIS